MRLFFDLPRFIGEVAFFDVSAGIISVMRWKLILSMILTVVGVGFWAPNVRAQSEKIPIFESSIGADADEEIVVVASESAEATPSGLVAKITEKGPDLTETGGEAKGKLGKLLLDQELGQLGPFNFLKHAVRNAVVNNDVPANTIVLILLFPLVTTIIAASRHLVGLRGFGIFTPAVVSVGFLATGIVMGIGLFVAILVVATLGRVIIRRLKLPYMPRTSLLLWLVSVGVLGLLLVSPYLKLGQLAQLSIFPILLLVLLAETFIDVQNKQGMTQAIEMTFETLILACITYFVMKLELVQRFVLLNPELVISGIALFNVFLGKFDGLRLSEYFRFRKIMD